MHPGSSIDASQIGLNMSWVSGRWAWSGKVFRMTKKGQHGPIYASRQSGCTELGLPFKWTCCTWACLIRLVIRKCSHKGLPFTWHLLIVPAMTNLFSLCPSYLNYYRSHGWVGPTIWWIIRALGLVHQVYGYPSLIRLFLGSWVMPTPPYDLSLLGKSWSSH